MNRYGASQLVEFYNDVQGYVSAFGYNDWIQEVRFPISISVSDAGQANVTLNTLIAETNFAAASVDLTDVVAGSEIHSGAPATTVVTLEGVIDMSINKIKLLMIRY